MKNVVFAGLIIGISMLFSACVGDLGAYYDYNYNVLQETPEKQEESDPRIKTYGFKVELPNRTWSGEYQSLTESMALNKTGHYSHRNPTLRLSIDELSLDASIKNAQVWSKPQPGSEFTLEIGEYTLVGYRSVRESEDFIVDRMFYPIEDQLTLSVVSYVKDSSLEGLEKEDPELQSIIQSVIELNDFQTKDNTQLQESDAESIWAEGTEDETNWMLTDDGTLHISGSGEMISCEDRAGYPWFQYRDAIKHVVISEGITSVGENAFSEYKNLESAEIADSVTELQYGCFEHCGTLKEVLLPQALETIDYYVFSNCDSLTEVAIPPNLKHIDNYSFAYCDALETVVIAPGVESLGYDVFDGCTSLREVYLPKSVKLIDLYAFRDTSLENIYYQGNSRDFEKVDIRNHNDELYEAEIHYDSLCK